GRPEFRPLRPELDTRAILSSGERRLKRREEARRAGFERKRGGIRARDSCPPLLQSPSFVSARGSRAGRGGTAVTRRRSKAFRSLVPEDPGVAVDVRPAGPRKRAWQGPIVEIRSPAGNRAVSACSAPWLFSEPASRRVSSVSRS